MSVGEYLSLNEKPYFEYRDGVLTQKAMPTSHHSILAFVMTAILRRQGAFAYIELTVQLSATRFLIPDVCVTQTASRVSPERNPPILCVEILSPSDRLGATLAKCEEYHDWGVEQCWVLDPLQRKAWQYQRGGEPTLAVGELRCGSLEVALEELFSALSEIDGR